MSSDSPANNTEKSTVQETAEQAAGKLSREASAPNFTERDIAKSESGQILKMTQQAADKYCKEHGGHLPTTREFAEFMNPNHILEPEYVKTVLKGQLPKGYYEVASQDKNGKVDTFYFNNEGGRALTGDIAKNSFWTSSIVLNKTDYAHVFYGPLGGGGGPASEHARTYPHAVIFIHNKQDSNKK